MNEAADFKSAVSTYSTTQAHPQGVFVWRRGPESNWANRICNPGHNRFATAPVVSFYRQKREAWASLFTEIGAGKESRTLDLNLGKVALYQLSYSRV
jgi:hypothetical protein